jgi:hypothetical protein
MDPLYPDEKLVDATGVHIDSVRKLSAWGAIKPAGGGRGRKNIRYWDRKTILRVARVGAIIRAGYSLRLSHTLACMFVVEHLFNIIDPEVLKRNAGDVRGWFDQNHLLSGNEDSDLKLVVANARLVFNACGSDLAGAAAVGMLSNDQSTCSGWFKISEHVGAASIVDPASLSWKFVPDMSVDGWREQLLNPVSICSINLSLATRIAMRRLLGLPIRFASPTQEQNHE